ncbi:MAG: hypothetical protein IJM45_00420 [Clostridia bacterium]|nr:hypothetical protein [Clostridia bacterium]
MTMFKKTITVLLAVCLIAVPFAFSASAADHTVLHYITRPEGGAYSIEVLTTDVEGNPTQYVADGESFSFKITPAEGQSLDIAQVSYHETGTGARDKLVYNIEHDVTNDVYTIENVNFDLTITVNLVMDSSSADMFRSLFEFLRSIIYFIGKLFNIDVGRIV